MLDALVEGPDSVLIGGGEEVLHVPTIVGRTPDDWSEPVGREKT